ncbi:hypothetical protein EB796_014417 [Bugula neritina]|uniref:Uncharacterized protein n=1 Tax=Bugula neritina TaxID=10212 RepID=A0A7J7JPC1_BUGNE|nr:hypothetical protein EB796_014417 [Bugula neritina]
MGFIRRAKRWGKLIFAGGIFILIIAYYRLRPDFVSTDDTASFTSYVNGKECKKQLNFHLTKVEKTGSSTLAAILSRFVLRHGKQNVMVMTIGGHLDVTKVQGQIPGWDIGPASNRKAQVLADHARFKESFIEEHFVPGIQRITLVREPVSWFLSAVRFWKQDATSVLTNNLNMGLRNDYSGVKTLFHLSQLQWLGFDYDQRNDLENIKKYVKNIVNK